MWDEIRYYVVVMVFKLQQHLHHHHHHHLNNKVLAVKHQMVILDLVQQLKDVHQFYKHLLQDKKILLTLSSFNNRMLIVIMFNHKFVVHKMHQNNHHLKL